MISIPLKFTAKTDMVPALSKFMSVRYKDETPKYHDALVELQSLRHTVASIGSASEAAREALLKYYAQTTLIGDKLPVTDGGNGAKVAFTWTDSLKPRKQYTQTNWLFEQACVLFNLAAVESQLAASTKRDSPQGIEAAGKRFCAAAGVLAHIRDVTLKSTAGGVVLGALPYDLTQEGLSMLINLLLAQGQACYYEMARGKGMKPETCAKLAGRAGDLYRESHRSLGEAAWADIDAELPWSVYTRLYTACFDAASFWQMAQKAGAEAQEKGDGYGVEVAWLRVAENACRKALEAVQASKLKPEVKATIDTSSASALLEQVYKKRLEAEEENSKIYMNLVPDARELPVVGRADLAKPSPFPDISAYTKSDLFASLVPTEVSGAVVELDGQVEDLVTTWKAKADEATNTATAALAAQNIAEKIEAGASGEAGIPDKLWERIARVVASGGVRELDTLSATLASAAEAARRVLDDAEAALDDEAAVDASYRSQYGDRWTAAPSSLVAAEQRGELAKLRKVADVAAGSDATVSAKLNSARAKLGALTQPRPQLEATIPSLPPASTSPSSIASAEGIESLRAALKTAVAELQSLTSARPTLVSNLKRGFDRGAAIRSLATAGTAAADDQTARVKAAVAKDSGLASAVAALQHNLASQPPALERVSLAAERYSRARATDERLAAREAALTSLSSDVSVYEELLSHLREGAEFYRNLKAHADALLVNARDLASARAIQQKELLLELRGGAHGSVPVATPLTSAHVEDQIALAARIGQMNLGPTPVAQPAGGVLLPPVPAPVQRSSSLVSASIQQPQAYNPFDTAFDESYPPRAAGQPLATAPPTLGSGTPSVGYFPTSPHLQHQASSGGYPSSAPSAYPTALPPPQAPQPYGQQAYQQQQPQYSAYPSASHPAPVPTGYGASSGYGSTASSAPSYGAATASIPYASPAVQRSTSAPQTPPQYAMHPNQVPLPQSQQPMAPNTMIPETPELRQLMAMGFERGAAHRALVANGGNVELSVNALVTGGVV